MAALPTPRRQGDAPRAAQRPRGVPLVVVACSTCGRTACEVTPGASVWWRCRRCGVWQLWEGERAA